MTTEQPRPMSIELSRTELFELVWQTPMSQLAKRFGISDTGLAKICKRLKVPYPSRGYWAQKAAGKKLAQCRLPAAGAKTPQSATIWPTWGEGLRRRPTSQVAAVLDAMRAEIGSVQVPEEISEPHPLIRLRMNEAARKAASNPEGAVPPLEHRICCILDTLFKSLEHLGATVRPNSIHRYSVRVGGHCIKMELREKYRLVRTLVTEEEAGSRGFDGERHHHDFEETGRLLFFIHTPLDGALRRRWHETDRITMEAMLPDIAATIIAAPGVVEEIERKREEERRAHEAAIQRKAEEKARARREEARFQRLADLAEASHRASQIRDFIRNLRLSAAEDEVIGDGQTLGDWLAWAEERLEAYDPLRRGAKDVFSEIAEIRAETRNSDFL